jgi:hypothetical protein
LSRARVASIVAAVFLIGSHGLIAAPQTGNESQTIAQSGADPLPIIPSAVNVLKANLAERSSSTAESEPKGFWIQGWNDPHQSFLWRIQVPRAGEYSIGVLVSGAPGSLIEIAGPENKLNVEIPEGNDHWGNNWNKIAVSWLACLAAGELDSHYPQLKSGGNHHQQEPVQGHGAPLGRIDF